MRKLPLFLAVLTLAAPLAAETFRTPVEVPVAGFKAVLDDGKVVCSWRRYKRTDFSSYHVVKSATKEEPVYPEDSEFWMSAAAGDIRAEDGKLSEGTWRYRLVIVTQFGDRWVSPPVTLVIGKKDLKRAAPTAADFETP